MMPYTSKHNYRHYKLQLALLGLIVSSSAHMILLQNILYVLFCQETHPFEESPHQMLDFFAIQAMPVFKILKIEFFKKFNVGWYEAWWYGCDW